LKYTLEGEHIDADGTMKGGMAVIRVDDDGIGISVEVLPRIFVLFN
jgi:signal transduction histidine kinase